MKKITSVEANALLDQAYLRGLATKLTNRGYAPQSIEQMQTTDSIARRLMAAVASGQIKLNFDELLSMSSPADEAEFNNAETAHKIATELMQDEDHFQAGLMAAEES